MSDSNWKVKKVKKLLGSGKSKEKFQTFKLPPDYSPDSLKILVNNSPWQRVESFRKSGPSDKVYILNTDAGEIQFGDGIHGACPPTGSNNITATYNYGGGTEGNVGVGKAKKKPKSPTKAKLELKK